MTKVHGLASFHTILAIDQSLVNCGYAVYQDGIISYGAENYQGCRTLQAKYRRFVRTIEGLIKKYEPDAIVIEDIRLFHRGAPNLQVIVRLSGFQALVIIIAKCGVYAIQTNVWKQAILGNANAQKEESITHVKKLGYEVASDDEADAICIALAATKIGIEMKVLV